jgi:hypothetical protein
VGERAGSRRGAKHAKVSKCYHDTPCDVSMRCGFGQMAVPKAPWSAASSRRLPPCLLCPGRAKAASSRRLPPCLLCPGRAKAASSRRLPPWPLCPGRAKAASSRRLPTWPLCPGPAKAASSRRLPSLACMPWAVEGGVPPRRAALQGASRISLYQPGRFTLSCQGDWKRIAASATEIIKACEGRP